MVDCLSVYDERFGVRLFPDAFLGVHIQICVVHVPGGAYAVLVEAGRSVQVFYYSVFGWVCLHTNDTRSVTFIQDVQVSACLVHQIFSGGRVLIYILI